GAQPPLGAEDVVLVVGPAQLVAAKVEVGHGHRRSLPAGFVGTGISTTHIVTIPPGVATPETGDQSTSMKMHSPGQSSAASITARWARVGTRAKLPAPPGSLRADPPSAT